MGALKVGNKVRVPWGLHAWVNGEVIEVWGDPADHIRVSLQFDSEEEPVLLLLTRSMVEAA